MWKIRRGKRGREAGKWGRGINSSAGEWEPGGEGWQTAGGKYFMVSFEGTRAEGWVGDSAGAAHSLDGSVGAWGVEGLRVPRTNQ